MNDFLQDSTLPSSYHQLSMEEIWKRGMARKQELGDQIFILCHHYQRDETFRFHDAVGDSLNLAQVAAEQTAPNLIFCGVHFMAESADILTTPEQSVILPNLNAGCSMADMAELEEVEDCWEALSTLCGCPAEDYFVPITYINSAANLKAFCGKHGGAVSTSSNAHKILTWAFDQNKKVLFFPDQHLGRNTANALKVPSEKIVLWQREQINGGLSSDTISDAKVLLWNGFCSVHLRFTVKQIEAARARIPGLQVIVHPECSAEVVQAADYSGSTNKISQIIRDSPQGSSWVVGTEINMVSRLHQELFRKEKKRIACLDSIVCPCSTMYCTHPANVLWVLDNLAEGRIVNTVQVPEKTAKWAKIALNQMLELS